jgi:hypothetical protein
MDIYPHQFNVSQSHKISLQYRVDGLPNLAPISHPTHAHHTPPPPLSRLNIVWESTPIKIRIRKTIKMEEIDTTITTKGIDVTNIKMDHQGLRR